MEVRVERSLCLNIIKKVFQLRIFGRMRTSTLDHMIFQFIYIDSMILEIYSIARICYCIESLVQITL